MAHEREYSPQRRSSRALQSLGISSASQAKASVRCRLISGPQTPPIPPIDPAQRWPVPKTLASPTCTSFLFQPPFPPTPSYRHHPSSTDTKLSRVSTSMKKASPNSHSYIPDRIRSWARTKAHGPSPLSKDSSRTPTLPLSNATTTTASTADANANAVRNGTADVPPFPSTDAHGLARQSSRPTANHVADNTSTNSPPPAPPPQADGQGTLIDDEASKKHNVAMRFWLTGKAIILSSYINLLLVFVPIGIASKAAGLAPGIIFGMNAVAIIPLAGLLSHATESVAKRMGDTIGALMNVTFGNAVELIILYVESPDDQRILLTSPACMSPKRDQDKKEREALLKALSYQSRPISSVPFLCSPCLP